MSGARPGSPEDIDLLAGEYVLGVLDSDEMRGISRRAEQDPHLARAIAGWERRLAPMLAAVDEKTPPAELWAEIQRARARMAVAAEVPAAPAATATILPFVRPPAAARPAAAARAWPWKAGTAASMALAAGLAAVVFVPSLTPRPPAAPVAATSVMPLVAVLAQAELPPEPRPETAPNAAQAAAYVAPSHGVEPRLSTGETAPQIAPQTSAATAPAPARSGGLLADVWPDGTVVLSALTPLRLPEGKLWQLWIKQPEDAAARSLGLMSALGQPVKLPAMPPAGTVLFITLEPAGALPGLPPGPVAYSGTLRPLPH